MGGGAVGRFSPHKKSAYEKMKKEKIKCTINLGQEHRDLK